MGFTPSSTTPHSPNDSHKYFLRRRPWRLNVTDFQTIIDFPYRGSGTSDDPYIVEWLENDLENPKNYSEVLRWSTTALIATMTLCVALASSAYSGTVGSLLAEFKCSHEVITLGLSLMVLGYAVGPLLWAPISESVGRRNIFLLSYTGYTVFTAGCCGSQNVWTLIILRFFTGLFGSSALCIPGGQIADMFKAELRGLGIGVFCLAPFIGPALGPIIGGFLGDAADWRWVMGLLAIFGALLTLMAFIFMPETYAPALLRARAERLSQATSKVYLTAEDAKNPIIFKELVKHALLRPWVLLFREPIVFSLTLYMSAIYGTLYLCFAAFPIVFQENRGWNAGVGGLGFTGVLVGLIVGILIICWDNKRYVRIYHATDGFAPPECRLPAVIAGGVSIVVGLAWFAATDSPNIHWVVPIMAGAPFGAGFVMVFICCANYLIDAYVIFAASVLAANSVMRSIFACVFPLFTTYMFNDIGIHWGVAVPGFIALACLPFPVLFYVYGAKIRARCKYAALAEEHLRSTKVNGNLSSQPSTDFEENAITKV
ncbi:Sucrose/H+ symporter, plant [Penicillium camemberti]|uniref:Sucrose/H+ symporter, plant n=1 Tax=Penicillium camemberti (strain FM 013) TaxID=1429867 RepID=A0A0G4P1W6_PENC3|nr:Sucrose/H+ symporter, plant [Penicillium camemberti]